MLSKRWKKIKTKKPSGVCVENLIETTTKVALYLVSKNEDVDLNDRAQWVDVASHIGSNIDLLALQKNWLKRGVERCEKVYDFTKLITFVEPSAESSTIEKFKAHSKLINAIRKEALQPTVDVMETAERWPQGYPVSNIRPITHFFSSPKSSCVKSKKNVGDAKATIAKKIQLPVSISPKEIGLGLQFEELNVANEVIVSVQKKDQKCNQKGILSAPEDVKYDAPQTRSNLSRKRKGDVKECIKKLKQGLTTVSEEPAMLFEDYKFRLINKTTEIGIFDHIKVHWLIKSRGGIIVKDDNDAGDDCIILAGDNDEENQKYYDDLNEEKRLCFCKSTLIEYCVSKHYYPTGIVLNKFLWMRNSANSVPESNAALERPFLQNTIRQWEQSVGKIEENISEVSYTPDLEFDFARNLTGRNNEKIETVSVANKERSYSIKERSEGNEYEKLASTIVFAKPNIAHVNPRRIIDGNKVKKEPGSFQETFDASDWNIIAPYMTNEFINLRSPGSPIEEINYLNASQQCLVRNPWYTPPVIEEGMKNSVKEDNKKETRTSDHYGDVEVLDIDSEQISNEKDEKKGNLKEDKSAEGDSQLRTFDDDSENENEFPTNKLELSQTSKPKSRRNTNAHEKRLHVHQRIFLDCVDNDTKNGLSRRVVDNFKKDAFYAAAATLTPKAVAIYFKKYYDTEDNVEKNYQMLLNSSSLENEELTVRMIRQVELTEKHKERVKNLVRSLSKNK